MERTTELDSFIFVAMLRQGAVALGREKNLINDLNVFPIPDGDTGDNMYMTMKAGVSSLQAALTPSVIASAAKQSNEPSGVDCFGRASLAMTAESASSGMLLGARGNSGVILSRIFAGLSKGLQGVVTADTKAFADAMSAAVAEAYKAIPIPVEGTIITVLREGVEAADASKDLTSTSSTRTANSNLATARSFCYV